MKRIYSLLILLVLTSSLFATTTIKGDFTLNGSLTLDEDFNSSVKSSSNINLFLLSKSNNIKYTIKYTIKNSLTVDQSAVYDNNIEQAYIQFRIPYKENYLTFNAGKTPLDIGGDWVYNSGTPFDINGENPWIASVKTKLFENENYQSLNLELMAKLPIEDVDSKFGPRLTYDINDEYFGTLEATLLSDLKSSILSGGINGNLFFDYGIYAKTDLQDLENFEVSLYLLKLYQKLTYKIEALYTNENSTLNILPTISYQIDTKSSIYLQVLSQIKNSSLAFSPTLSYNFNVIQGLDFTTLYSYNNITKNTFKAIITHKF